MKTYFNLQQVIAANTLVVHFMVGIIGITTGLILNEGKPASSVNDIRVVTNRMLGILTDEMLQFEELGYHSGPNGHSYEDIVRLNVPSNGEYIG